MISLARLFFNPDQIIILEHCLAVKLFQLTFKMRNQYSNYVGSEGWSTQAFWDQSQWPKSELAAAHCLCIPCGTWGCDDVPSSYSVAGNMLCFAPWEVQIFQFSTSPLMICTLPGKFHCSVICCFDIFTVSKEHSCPSRCQSHLLWKQNNTQFPFCRPLIFPHIFSFQRCSYYFFWHGQHPGVLLLSINSYLAIYLSVCQYWTIYFSCVSLHLFSDLSESLSFPYILSLIIGIQHKWLLIVKYDDYVLHCITWWQQK